MTAGTTRVVHPDRRPIRVGDATRTPVDAGARTGALCGTAAAATVTDLAVGDRFADLPTVETWSHHGELVGEVVCDTVVTRADEDAVRLSVVLERTDGTVVARGDRTYPVTPDDAVTSDPPTAFGTVEWGELLRERLDADPVFSSSLSTWDGTLGLRCDDREVHLRIYRGRVVDATRRAPHGATCTFVASGRSWVALTGGDRTDFMRRALGGEFSSTGDGYEYLRLTKPLDALLEQARLLVHETRDRADAPTTDGRGRP